MPDKHLNFTPYEELDKWDKQLVDSTSEAVRISAVDSRLGWDKLIRDESEAVLERIMYHDYAYVMQHDKNTKANRDTLAKSDNPYDRAKAYIVGYTPNTAERNNAMALAMDSDNDYLDVQALGSDTSYEVYMTHEIITNDNNVWFGVYTEYFDEDSGSGCTKVGLITPENLFNKFRYEAIIIPDIEIPSDDFWDYNEMRCAINKLFDEQLAASNQ